MEYILITLLVLGLCINLSNKSIEDTEYHTRNFHPNQQMNHRFQLENNPEYRKQYLEEVEELEKAKRKALEKGSN